MKIFIKKIINKLYLKIFFKLLSPVYYYLCGQNFNFIYSKLLTEKNFTKLPHDGEKISIICSVWNIDIMYLRETIQAVCNQHYKNWEFCINCCCDNDRFDIKKLLKEYQLKDNRIRIIFSKNESIAINSNIAFNLATGKYVFLLDHDDILPPISLAMFMERATATDADFIYADEYVMFMNSSKRCIKTRKGDFQLNKLYDHNFINHPVMIRSKLFQDVGGFQEGYDGSQDHDLYLRLAECKPKISYIPEPLYFWRINDNSLSQRNLQQCINSGKKALKAHFSRINKKVDIINLAGQTIYKIIYKK